MGLECKILSEVTQSLFWFQNKQSQNFLPLYVDPNLYCIHVNSYMCGAGWHVEKTSRKGA